MVRTEEEGTVARSEEEGTLVRSEEEGTLVRSKEEGTLVRSEEEGTLVRSEEEGTLVRSEAEGTYFCSRLRGVGPPRTPLWIRACSQTSITSTASWVPSETVALARRSLYTERLILNLVLATNASLTQRTKM